MRYRGWKKSSGTLGARFNGGSRDDFENGIRYVCLSSLVTKFLHSLSFVVDGLCSEIA